jgi:hypothetical protein
LLAALVAVALPSAFPPPDPVLRDGLEGQCLIAEYDDGASEIVIDPASVLGNSYHLRITAANSRI